MTLKNDIEIKTFFDRVHCCTGEAWFETDMGDRLNLKSQLSKCLFAAAFLSRDIELTGELICEDPSDMELLREFCN